MEERSSTAALALGLSPEDLTRLTGLYHGRLAELGLDVRTVGWGSRADQLLRFEVLCRGLDLRGRRVLDLGCGLGDFVPWAEQKFGDDFEYVGLDLSHRLVAAAQERFGGPGRTFIADTLGPDTEIGEFDVIVLSGALTFRVTDNLAVMRALLTEAFVRCRGAVCANFLSSYADRQLAKNFHFVPGDVFAFARTLTPYVALYHDYPLYEFTIQLLRQPILQRASQP